MSSKSKPSANERRARSEQMKAEREAAQRAAERRSRLFIALAVVAAIALVAVAVFATRGGGSGGDAAVPAGVTAPDGGAPVGDPGAPVVMDEWIDFSCPACAAFEASLGETISELVDAGELQVVYHPLSFINQGSVRAANAFGCAIEQDKTAEFYSAVFAAQGPESQSITNDQLIDIGAQIGLDNDEFEQCVTSGAFDGWVENVAASGPANGVTGTPTIFLNGELTEVPGFDPQTFRDLVAAAAQE